MAKLYMMVGIPGSGKSTWLSLAVKPGDAIISTDNHIEMIAYERGLVYNDVFKEVIGEATNNMYRDVKTSVAQNLDIYWDQTNLTVKSRAGKLKKIPDSYEKTAVIFGVPEDLNERLASREGKTIPGFVIANMIKSFEVPTFEEGFTDIQVAFNETEQ